jgi:glycosyltransferase involved in cell wall biosynthesis
MHYAVPIVLERSGLLAQLFTDAYAGKESCIGRFLRLVPGAMVKGNLKHLAERSADLPIDRVTAYNWLGFRYALARRESSPSNRSNIYLEYGKRFLNKVSQSRFMELATCVYGFTGTSLELFHVAREEGLYRICEQMSAPIEDLSHLWSSEFDRWSDWSIAEEQLSWDLSVWRARQFEEWSLSDVVIAPSSYIRDRLIESGVPTGKIVVVPYAVSASEFVGRVRSYDCSRPLRVLFVGRVSIPKGIQYLLEALLQLGPSIIQAKLVGSVMVDGDKLFRYKDVVEIVGSVPRGEVKRYYHWADVFVFPSLCEGSAVVTYEARSCGLPIVVTHNAGAWVREGIDGLTVPIRDTKAIVEALVTFLEEPALVEYMSKNALESASDFTWDAYQRRLKEVVSRLHHDSVFIGDEGNQR